MTTDALGGLLASEIQRHLSNLQPSPQIAELRTVLHAVKGSAALARYHDLALVASQLGARLRAGDEAARVATIVVLEQVASRLSQGLLPFETQWPAPPPDLLPSVVNPDIRPEYVATMNDHLREIDDALDRHDPHGSLDHAYRTVHTMKSTAASAGDEVAAWYCHGLESRLKQASRSEPEARALLGDLARHRAVLVQLLEQPARALETLRAVKPARHATPPPPPPAYTVGVADADAILRVPTAVVDTFLERLDRTTSVHDELLGAAAGIRSAAGQLRDHRGDLLDGLRDLGPPRGGAATAYGRVEGAARGLTDVADSVDHAAATCRRNAETLHANAQQLRAEIAALRRTTARWIFTRARRAIRNLTPPGQEVHVETAGADLSLDRRTADALLEPVLQLARNAVAHGLESVPERRRANKPDVGTIFLHAERLASWIRITVADDGRGVDLPRIRALAHERADVPNEALPEAEDDLLALLFLPGMTTRESADLLGGRGVGLELAQDAVRALGGSIRLARRRGSGLLATVEVPAERGMVNVLWFRSCGTTFALPASFVSEILPLESTRPCVTLAELLELPRPEPPRLAIRLAPHGLQPFAVAVDAVAHVEQVLIRPIPALVAAASPFNGAILRSDGSLRLVLDPALVAARAWAHVP